MDNIEEMFKQIREAKEERKERIPYIENSIDKSRPKK